MMDKYSWNGAKTRLVKKLFKSISKSIYFNRDMSDSAWELLGDNYIKSTKFGFGNYELTKKGIDKAKSLL